MYIKDGFLPRGKAGRHKYFKPITVINNAKIIRLALPAWVVIKEFLGIYKINNRNIKYISMISKLSSFNIESSMREANLLKYSSNILLSNPYFNYKKRFLYLIANGCKNQKLYELLNIATIKLEQRLFKKKANLQKFKKKYIKKV